jgi:hypothetical protein
MLSIGFLKRGLELQNARSIERRNRDLTGRFNAVSDTRQKSGNERVHSFQFAPLANSRRQFASHIGARHLEWEPDNKPKPPPGATVGQTAKSVGKQTASDIALDAPQLEWEPVIEPDDIEWEPVDEPESD